MIPSFPAEKQRETAFHWSSSCARLPHRLVGYSCFLAMSMYPFQNSIRAQLPSCAAMPSSKTAARRSHGRRHRCSLARKLKRGTRILSGGRRGFPWRARCRSPTRRRRMSSRSSDGRCKAGRHKKSVDEIFTRMVLARCSPTACLTCLLQTSLDVIAMLPPDLVLLKNYANLHKPRPLSER